MPDLSAHNNSFKKNVIWDSIFPMNLHSVVTCVGEALTWHGPQVNLRCDKCGKHFKTMDVTPPQYLRTLPLKQLAGATRAPGGGPAPKEIGDTSEEAVNVNETTPT